MSLFRPTLGVFSLLQYDVVSTAPACRELRSQLALMLHCAMLASHSGCLLAAGYFTDRCLLYRYSVIKFDSAVQSTVEKLTANAHTVSNQVGQISCLLSNLHFGCIMQCCNTLGNLTTELGSNAECWVAMKVCMTLPSQVSAAKQNRQVIYTADHDRYIMPIHLFLALRRQSSDETPCKPPHSRSQRDPRFFPRCHFCL